MVDAYEGFDCFGEVSSFVVSEAPKWNTEQRPSFVFSCRQRLLKRLER
jgi:hypothetical protein